MSMEQISQSNQINHKVEGKPHKYSQSFGDYMVYVERLRVPQGLNAWEVKLQDDSGQLLYIGYAPTEKEVMCQVLTRLQGIIREQSERLKELGARLNNVEVRHGRE